MIQVFQIKPEFSGLQELNISWNFDGHSGVSNHGMIDIGASPNVYTFIVRTREKPGTKDKEKIKGDIERAWEGLFNVSDSNWERFYAVKVHAPPLGVSVIGPSSDKVPLSGDLPLFEPGFFYMVFVHMESEGEVSEDDSRANQEELRESFEKAYGALENPPRIALIPIYNCTIELVEGAGERRYPSRGDQTYEIMRRHGLR